MPKVQTNLVCKVTSHLKSKTHNIALSDAMYNVYSVLGVHFIQQYLYHTSDRTAYELPSTSVLEYDTVSLYYRSSELGDPL